VETLISQVAPVHLAGECVRCVAVRALSQVSLCGLGVPVSEALDDLNSLTEAGAETLIRLLATDTWEGVKQLAGRLLNGRDKQLASSKDALAQNPDDGNTVSREVARWQTRLQDAIDNDESLHEDLRRFVDEHKELASPISQRQRTGNRSVAMQASATGTSKVNQVQADGAKKVVVDSPRHYALSVPVIGPVFGQAIQHKVIATIVAVALSGGLAFGVKTAASEHGTSPKSTARSVQPTASSATAASSPSTARAATPTAAANNLLAALKVRPTKFRPSESAFKTSDLQAISELILTSDDVRVLFGENLAPIAPSTSPDEQDPTYDVLQDLDAPDCVAASLTEHQAAEAQVDGANPAAGDAAAFINEGKGTISPPAKYYQESITVTPSAEDAHTEVSFFRALVECQFNFKFTASTDQWTPFADSQIVDDDSVGNEFVEGYEMTSGSTNNPYILQASVGRYIVTIYFYGADPDSVFHLVQGHLNQTAAKLEG